MRIFSPDSILTRVLRIFSDMVHINLLILLFSVPIVTSGAAICAGISTAQYELDGNDGITKYFFERYKEYLKDSMLPCILCIILGASIAYSWYILLNLGSVNSLFLIPTMLLSTVFLFINTWIWVLIAGKYHYSFVSLVKNALLISIAKLPLTFLILFGNFIYLFTIILVFIYAKKAIFLILILGLSLPIFVTAKVQNDGIREIFYRIEGK